MSLPNSNIPKQTFGNREFININGWSHGQVIIRTRFEKSSHELPVHKIV